MPNRNPFVPILEVSIRLSPSNILHQFLCHVENPTLTLETEERYCNLGAKCFGGLMASLDGMIFEYLKSVRTLSLDRRMRSIQFFWKVHVASRIYGTGRSSCRHFVRYISIVLRYTRMFWVSYNCTKIDWRRHCCAIARELPLLASRPMCGWPS